MAEIADPFAKINDPFKAQARPQIGAAAAVPQEARDPQTGIRFGGSAATAAEIPEGPNWKEAQATLVQLEKDGVPETDPRYQQALKERGLGLARLTTGGYQFAAPRGLSQNIATEAAPKAASVISRLLPGATKRAEQAITKIAPSFDKDKIGQSVLAALRPNYDALYATRSRELAKVGLMEEGPQKTAAFRKVYQDAKYADLREFEDSPLGKKVIATTSRYSDVPKINPKSFMDQAFRSPQDVRDLKQLFKGNQQAVEQTAAQYASSELKGILENAKATSVTEANPLKSEAGNVATALTRWRVQNSDWLKEVPATKQVVDDFVDNMVAVAKTQKNFKIATVAGMTLGLFEEGYHPFSWVGRLMGGVE